MAKRRSFSIPRVWQYIGVGVLAVVTFGLVVQAFQPVTSPVSADTRPAVQPSDFVTPEPVVTPAVFIGDSYTQGEGASSDSARWSTLVSEAEGWAERNEGLGGTGFVSTADVNGCGLNFCPTYGAVLDTLSFDTPPAVVVIAGGQNDLDEWATDPAVVMAAIQALYANARARFPDARIIAVGPSAIGDVTAPVTEMDAAVQAAAASVGAEYMSLLNPDVLDPSMDAGDGAHVSDVGHRAIADRVLGL